MSKAIRKTEINGHSFDTLIDTGSSNSFISKSAADRIKTEICPVSNSVHVFMAVSSLSLKILGVISVILSYLNYSCTNVQLSILKNLCSDVIIWQDNLKNHESLQVHFGGSKPGLSICGLTAINITPPPLFENLSSNIRPIAVKPRRCSTQDGTFIESEICCLLKDVIEPSTSPCRAQVVIVSDEHHKRRMVIDYSSTINRFIELDAYPLSS